MRLHTASHRPLFLVMDLSMNQNKCVRIIVLKEDKWQNWPSFSVLRKTPLWGEGGAGSSGAVRQLEGCWFEPHLSKCPWGRHWTPKSSHWASTLHGSLCHWKNAIQSVYHCHKPYSKPLASRTKLSPNPCSRSNLQNIYKCWNLYVISRPDYWGTRCFYPNSLLILTVHITININKIPPTLKPFRWSMNYRYRQMPICHLMLLIFFVRRNGQQTYHHVIGFLPKKKKKKIQETSSSGCAMGLPHGLRPWGRVLDESNEPSY